MATSTAKRLNDNVNGRAARRSDERGTVKIVHVCTECGSAHPKWSGQCSGCGDWNTLVEEVEGSVAADVPLLPSHRPGPDADRRRSGTGGRTDRHVDRRTRPRAGRWAGAGLGHAARGRAGHRQEHAAAPTARRVGRADALRHRRGERAPGPTASAAVGRDPRGSVAPRRNVAAAHHRRDRQHETRTRGHRLDPDGPRPRDGRPPGQRRPGPGVRATPGRRSEGPQRGHRARRPRHQGRGPRRTTGARARGRHGPAVRGRPSPRAAPVRARPSIGSGRRTNSDCSRWATTV